MYIKDGPYKLTVGRIHEIQINNYECMDITASGLYIEDIESIIKDQEERTKLQFIESLIPEVDRKDILDLFSIKDLEDFIEYRKQNPKPEPEINDNLPF